jgi:sugar phosphate isomerase/epimerase
LFFNACGRTTTAMDTAFPNPSMLSVALAPFDGSPKQTMAWAVSEHFRCVQLPATRAGLRPRDLDRSARRDLAAALARLELRLSGLDLWIPPDHFIEDETADRAVDATAATIDLAEDLGRVPISFMAPTGPDAAAVLQMLSAQAERQGVTLIDFTAAPVDGAEGASAVEQWASVRPGVDPALVLAAGQDPAERVVVLGADLGQVRLSDWDGQQRVPVGQGRLDPARLRAMLSVIGHTAPIVVDPRTLPDPGAAVRQAVRAWEQAVGSG